MSAARKAPAPRFATAPGLVLLLALVATAMLVAGFVPWLSPLTVAVVIGMVVGNTVGTPRFAEPGLRVSARVLLRIGIALLGLQLVTADAVALGLWPVVGVCGALLIVFTATVWVGGRLGLPRARALLVAAGVAVCGAAAVAAMSSVADGDEEDAATAVAVVTLYGTAAIFFLPLAAAPLGLDPVAAGTWAGASVHEVAQVVATASPYGEAALLAAVVVKLVRVLMLAPLVILVGVVARRSSGDRSGGRRVLVPWFVVAFVVAVGVRATGSVPSTVLTLTESVSQVLLAAALVSMGTGVRIGRLARSGGPALLLGLLATILAVALGLPIALLSST